MPMTNDKRLTMMEVWAKGFALWKKSFKAVFLLIVFWVVWLFLPLYLIPSLIHMTLIKLIVFTLIYLVGSLFFSVSAYYLIYQKSRNHSVSPFRALKEALLTLPTLFIAGIIATLMLSVGFLLFFPGIYLLVFAWFYFPIIIIDKKGPITALEESFNLVRGHWWETAATIGIPFLLVFALILLVEHLTVGIDVFKIIIYENSIGWYMQHIFEYLLAILYFPYFLSLVVIQLQNLKVKYTQDFIDQLADYPVLPKT